MSLSHSTRLRGGRLAALAVAATIALTGVGAPVLAAEPGQTSTVSGTVVGPTGAPVSDADVSYQPVTCDATHTRIPAGPGATTATTNESGAWSFAAYPGQCYYLDLGGKLISYNGKTSLTTVVPAGAHNVKLVTNLETKSVTVKLPGVADGTPVSLLLSGSYQGIALWFPTTSESAAAGTATFHVAPGAVYTVAVARNGDYFDQYVNGSSRAPSLSGGAGTFTVPASASTTTIAATLKKSGPVVLKLANVDAGATVDASTIAGLGAASGGLGFGSVEAETLSTGVTLRGLQPEAYVVRVSGSRDGFPSTAEAVGVTPKLGTATTTVTLSGAQRGTTLSDSTQGQAVVPTVTADGGSYKVGGTLRATTTLTGAAAGLLSVAGTKVTQYWIAGDLGGFLGGGAGSTSIVGTGPTLPITAGLLNAQSLVVVSVVTAPGLDLGVGLGVAFVDPKFLSISGLLPFNLGQVELGDAPFPSVAPSVSGSAVVGGTLTARPGTWNPKPTSFRYQWSLNGKAIAGATKPTYALGAAQVGKSLTVTVTPVLAGYRTRSFTSVSTAKVVKAASTSTVKAVKSTVKANKKKIATAKVTVVVSVKGVVPAGKIAVKVDKKTTNVSLASSKKGKATVTLSKLKKGKHTVTVRYLGSSTVAASAWSKKITITVK